MCPPAPDPSRNLLPTPTTQKQKNILPSKRKKNKNRVLFRVSFLRLESRRKSRKKFSQSIARAATSQPFSFRGTSLLEWEEGVVVTQVKISVSKCVAQPNFKKKFQRRSNRVPIIVQLNSLSTRKKWSSGSAKGNHHHVRAPLTHTRTAQTTTQHHPQPADSG